jgi:TonB family protein
MKEYKNSTVVSLVFHIILIIGLIGFKSAHILVPSRSNGIEVSLVSDDEIAPTTKNISQVKNPEPIKTVTDNADIHVKQTDAKQNKPAPSKVIQPTVAKNPNPNTLQQKPQKKKVKTNKQINDLLNQITPSDTASGKTKSQVTGGVDSGTSDTDNMISNYADLVIQKVRPFVVIPDNLDNNAKAIVDVTLLPSMEVFDIKLIKSSGNSDYDNNVQQAIDRVRVFPPLPDKAKFSDYRVLRLTFKPQ